MRRPSESRCGGQERKVLACLEEAGERNGADGRLQEHERNRRILFFEVRVRVCLSVLSCGSVCRSCVTVIARLASTHTALVSQSLVGLCVAFPSINHTQIRCPVGLAAKGFFLDTTREYQGFKVVCQIGVYYSRVASIRLTMNPRPRAF